MARPLGNAPPSPPNERPAAWLPARTGGRPLGLADYTSSRVLQAPGGASSFILSDGSGRRSRCRTYEAAVTAAQPHSARRRDDDGGGRASGRPPHAFMDAAGGQLHRRRDPNASSQLGGMFEGSVWG